MSEPLLGLAGSLVVGLLELFAGHGQNRFYRELEEWVSTITRLGISSGDSDATTEQDAVIAVLEHMDNQMEGLREIIAQSDIARSQVDQRLGSLADSLERVAAQLDRDDSSGRMLERVVDGQQRLVEVLDQQSSQGGGGGMDAESRMRLRSMDVQLLRILEEMSAGRQESTINLRSDIAALTEAVRELTRAATEG